MAELPGAELALALDVILLRYGGNPCRIAKQLAGALENDFRASVVIRYVSSNLDLTSGQLPDISHMPEVTGKDDHRERARAVVLAEIKKMRSAAAFLYS